MEQIDISSYRRKRGRRGVPQISVILSKDITFGSGNLGDQKKGNFFFELSTLLESGIDLKHSLDLITLEGSRDKHLQVYLTIKEKVISGEALAEALKQTAKFSDYDYYSVEIGEETGNLAKVLKELAIYYNRKVNQRRKITGALTYPIIVLCTSGFAVFFMLRFVVPMFSDVFKRFGGKLPWMTELVINASNLMGVLFLPLLILAGGIGYYLYINRKNERFRDMSSKIVLAIPVINELVIKIYLARFCNTMKLLISTRIPLLRAISMTRNTIGFYPIERSLKQIEIDIVEGKTLHASLRGFTFYPPKLIQLIKVGEEVNRLDYFFENIADQYVKEVEHQTNTVSKLIEPVIIIFLGLVVGFILISMYLPMFEMSNSF